MINDPSNILLSKLIECKSITPEDNGCQDIILNRLEAIGFECEKINFGEVKNLWALLKSKDGPTLHHTRSLWIALGKRQQWREEDDLLDLRPVALLDPTQLELLSDVLPCIACPQYLLHCTLGRLVGHWFHHRFDHGVRHCAVGWPHPPFQCLSLVATLAASRLVGMPLLGWHLYHCCDTGRNASCYCIL